MTAIWILATLACTAFAAPLSANASPNGARDARSATSTAPQSFAGGAAQAYQRGDYAAAAAAFQAAAHAEPSNAYAQYDLGNALLKTGALGAAVARYQRAFELDPRDGDIRYNLDFALRKAGESLVPEGTPAALFVAFHFFSRDELLGLLWLCWWALFLALAAWLALPRKRETIAPAALACAAAFVFFGAWWAARKSAEPGSLAVVISGNAEARSGPGVHFPVSFNPPEGRRLAVVDEQGDWLEIGTLKEGHKGWLPAKDVERITP